METGLLGKGQKKGGEGGQEDSRWALLGWATATREGAKDLENQVGGGKGRGPSPWKSPEELAATAWEKELVVQRLRVWESPGLAPGHQKGNPTVWARVAALRLVRGQAWDSGLQSELQDMVGARGGRQRKARLARRRAGGGPGWGWERRSGLTQRPRGVQCTKPGVQITPWQPRAPALTRTPGTCRGPRAAHEKGHPLPSLAHLEHKPYEDAEHQAEADVRVVVDDELLAEERVTFRPPAESHGSGRAAAGGPRTLRSRAAAQTCPAPARSARRPAARSPSRPPAQRPTTSGARPLPPPAPGPPPGTAPGRSPLPTRGRARRAGLPAAPPPRA